MRIYSIFVLLNSISKKKFLIEKKIMKKLSSKDDLHLSGYIGQPADIEVRS